MRPNYFLFFLLFHLSLNAQENESNLIIPYLCDNDKYGIADLSSSTHSDCIFDELTTSRVGVTLGEINGKAVFVKKDGTYSPPISDLTYSSERKIYLYEQLNSHNRYFSSIENGTTYIYDSELNLHHGPLLEPATNRNRLRASYSSLFNPSPQRFVFFSKGENQFVLSTTGATKELPSNKPSSYQIKDKFLYYIGDVGESSIIYDENFEEQLVADTIIFGTLLRNFTFAQKDGKTYKIEPNITIDSIDYKLKSNIKVEEIANSLKWDLYGYSYHESETNKWIEDKGGAVYYALNNDERVIPFLNNILLYRGNTRQFLLGDKSLKLRQPHISISQIGKNKRKFLFQDSTGYYILNPSGKLDSDDVYKKAHRVDKYLLWVEYKDGKRALLDEDLEVIFNTGEDIVKAFIGNTYVYKVDSLYGLLDSIGKRITPPLSTQSDFYTAPDLEWIKIDHGKKAYIYNIYTKSRTEGLSNEFYISDKYHDEYGENLISSYTYGIDSTNFYRQDGSIYTVLSRSEAQHFQKEKHRYTRVETFRDNYVYIDKLNSDTLLTCNDCDGMYMIDLDHENGIDFVVCSYRNLRQDLYDKRGTRLLPHGMSLLRYPPFGNEVKHYPKIIVQQASKIGVYDIEKKETVIPIIYARIDRMGENRLSLRSKGKNQITDLNGSPINDAFYYRTYALSNGDISAQLPMEGMHKKKVYFDVNDPNMDPCEGKIVDAPNYYYKILDKEGKSRFNKKFIAYNYQSDDLINVEEWTGKDTIYYCMNIKGKKRKTTAKDVRFRPFFKDIIEKREGRQFMFVDKNLNPIVNRKFNTINYHEVDNETIFYIGNDSTFTYVYNENFEQTAKIKGNYSLSRYGTSMLYLSHYDHKAVFLLNINGTPFTDTMLTKAGYHNQQGVMKYKKGEKEVYIDMVNGRRFWD
jgi:hypothetical protein